MRVLIGLCGSAGSGKSTAAFHLIQKYGFKRVRFAGPLKAMAAAIGLTERHIEGDLKEVPCDLIGGKTPRYFMQTLGTEWGRNIIGTNLWTDLWKFDVLNTPDGVPIVVDDLRFPNEETAFRSMGGKVIRIMRDVDKTTQTFTHESEKHVIASDFQIMNDGSLGYLYDSLDAVYKLVQS
jgi:hypothetical protein